MASANDEKTKKSVILDVKPWDDETDLVEMEKLVRSVEMDGLAWGGPGQLVPLAFGIQKLQIACIIDGDKVSVDDLIETITEQFEDHVQSVELVAINIL
uniref:Translation elongation factor EF1B beta/delta subunit guanine nucleotide exchange domain-containing protein n=1 Tax=Plectus sambesii TaxID=2011161 RepID=A0A914VF40_9BILA